MKAKEFNNLIKKYKKNLDYIVRLYCMDKLYLTNYQLNKVLNMRGEKKYPHYELIGKRKVIVQ